MQVMLKGPVSIEVSENAGRESSPPSQPSFNPPNSLILGERTVNLADIYDPPVGGGHRLEVLRQVGKRHEGLALREDGKRPFRKAQDANPASARPDLMIS